MKGNAVVAAMLLTTAVVLAVTEVEQAVAVTDGSNMQNLAGKCIKFKPQKAGTYSFEVRVIGRGPRETIPTHYLHCSLHRAMDAPHTTTS
jgi:hypothetical protein